MNTATRIPDHRESAAETQRRLPKLDTSRIPLGLDTLGEPFKKLGAERSRLMKEALKARGEAETADFAIYKAREQDGAEFERAALARDADPGRVHEMAALSAQDEAQRKAIGLTRAHNAIVKQIRQAIDGDPGDKAEAKARKQLDADLERMREGVESALDVVGTVAARLALIDSIEQTRKADHVSLRSSSPRSVEVRASGTTVDATAALEALLQFDPRQGR